MPESIEYPFFTGDQQIYVTPYAQLVHKQIKVTTTAANVPGTKGQEGWRNYLGYVFWLDGYSVWYTGAIGKDIRLVDKTKDERIKGEKFKEGEIISKYDLVPGEMHNDLLRMHEVDIMIVPLTEPGDITSEFLVKLSKIVKPKAIFFVGLDNQKNKSFLNTFLRETIAPVWLPSKLSPGLPQQEAKNDTGK